MVVYHLIIEVLTSPQNHRHNMLTYNNQENKTATFYIIQTFNRNFKRIVTAFAYFKVIL